MKTNIIFVSLMMFILLTGCNLFSVPDKEKSGQIQFFITDSTGTERYSFHVNEPIYVHIKLINNTNHDIFYYRLPYGGDNELFYYKICPPGEDVIDPIGYPPDSLKLHFMPKHVTYKQVYKIEGLEANEYKIILEQFILLKNPNDIEENYKTKYLITVEE